MHETNAYMHGDHSSLILNRVRNAIPTDARINKNGNAKSVIVAVSGGRDSMALLHAAWSTRVETEATIIVATLDHGTRGAESQADADFVVQYCVAHGIRHERQTVDAPRYAHDHGLNLEAGARQLRYQFLAEVAHRHQANSILTAHHAEDNAESVLLNLFRGAALSGLGGMRAESTLNTLRDAITEASPMLIIRPLLDVPRAAIESYIADNAIPYRDDSTNTDTRFSRNRLRHTMRSAYAAEWPTIAVHIADTATGLQQDYALIQHWISQVARFDHDRCYAAVNIHDLPIEPSARQSAARWIVMAAIQHIDSRIQLTREHLMRGAGLLLGLVTQGASPAQFEDMLFMRDETTLAIIHRMKPGPGFHSIPIQHDPIPLLFDTLHHFDSAKNSANNSASDNVSDSANNSPSDNINNWNNWIVQMSPVRANTDPSQLSDGLRLNIPHDTQTDAHINTRINARIAIRRPLPADQFAPHGMHGAHQSVRDMLANARIPLAWRASAWIVTLNDAPIAVIARTITGSYFRRAAQGYNYSRHGGDSVDNVDNAVIRWVMEE